MKATVVLLATCDTKGEEARYIRQRVEAYGAQCSVIDVGAGGAPTAEADISLGELCLGTAFTAEAIRGMKRGDAVDTVSDLAQKYVGRLADGGMIDAVAGIGGAGGTQICTQVMRSLPVGLPKLMLSTLTSGNMRWYVADSDIAMFPSIMDVAGVNSITRMVFDRFAAGAASLAVWYAENYDEHARRMADGTVRRIGMTMYGTTTAGVTRASKSIEQYGYEPLVFHASGAGGRAMENFVRRGVIHGVLDMTLAEIGAHLVGGLHDAGPGRLDGIMETGVPLVLVPGAADTVVLPPFQDLPDRFRQGRVLNRHNAAMTTMRTDVDENIQIGEFIVRKLRKAKGAVKVLIPLGGLSSIDRPGEVFYMPEANKALFDTLKNGLAGTDVEVLEDERHICDPGFGEAAAGIMDSLMKTVY